jgi:hypothetical protein
MAEGCQYAMDRHHASGTTRPEEQKATNAPVLITICLVSDLVPSHPNDKRLRRVLYSRIVL